MPEIVNEIPEPISGLTQAIAAQFQLDSHTYDYALAGIPFLSGENNERPYTERMAEVRKEQFDNFAEPGEQSLQGWWLRSQSTFTGGAGVLYQDPDNDNQFNYRFADSLGVDPWTAGNLKLLRDTEIVTSSASTPSLVQGFVDTAGDDAYWVVANDTLTKVEDSGTTSVIGVTGITIRDITSSGRTYILAKDDGVYTGVDAGAATKQYNAALTDPVIEAVKDRIILGHANAVYELAYAPPGAPVALPTAEYTHPDTSWRWRSITDGPTAIYVAGDSGTTSQIHKFTVVDNAGVATLQWAGVTATMPTGETIRTIYQYVGSFVGIATNKGFRVGEIDQNGDISYGPLLFEPSGGCRGIVGSDRFMFVGSTNAHDGQSGLYRVDLGSSVQEQTTRAIRYAYARDIYIEGEVDAITSVTMYGASDRKVFSVDTVGSVREMETQLIETGYLTTGRIRYNTEEPKLYKFFSVRTPSPLQGDISINVLTEGGGEIPTITFGPALAPTTKDVAITNPMGPQNWLALKFILDRGVDPAFGGVLNGWQVKALPGSIRQRIITHVFLVFDNVKDRSYKQFNGMARRQFEAFKQVARAGDVVLFQDVREKLSAQVLIEDWEFRQTTPPNNKGPLGGYLTVVMRTTAESI